MGEGGAGAVVGIVGKRFLINAESSSLLFLVLLTRHLLSQSLALVKTNVSKQITETSLYRLIMSEAS